MPKINEHKRKKHSRIREPELKPRNKAVVFSFERIQRGAFCLSNLCKDDLAAVAGAIFKRKDFTIQDFINNPKHGLGSEKIKATSIKTPLPVFITDDGNNDSLLALRYNGKKAMVGYFSENIFYLLWFDPKFKLYNHG